VTLLSKQSRAFETGFDGVGVLLERTVELGKTQTARALRRTFRHGNPGLISDA
jgi:hypothetical protein